MKKYQLKERGFLLLTDLFLNLTFKKASKQMNIDLIKRPELLDKEDLKMLNVLKTLRRLRKTLNDKRIVDFTFKRVPSDLDGKEATANGVAALFVYFYKMLDFKREFSLPIERKEIKEIIEDMAKDGQIENPEIDYVTKCLTGLYPDKRESIEFFAKRIKEKK